MGDGWLLSPIINLHWPAKPCLKHHEFIHQNPTVGAAMLTASGLRDTPVSPALECTSCAYAIGVSLRYARREKEAWSLSTSVQRVSCGKRRPVYPFRSFQSQLLAPTKLNKSHGERGRPATPHISNQQAATVVACIAIRISLT